MERFALPDSLDGLTDEAFSELDSAANERLAALRGVSNPSQADIDELAAIKSYRSAVKELRTVRAEFATDVAALNEPEPVVAATPVPASAPVPAPAPSAPAAAPEPTPAPSPEPVPEPVVAAAEPVVEPEPPATRPEPSVAIPETTRPALVMTAAADIPQVPMGSELDVDGLSNAITNKVRALGNSTQRHPVATIQKQFAEGYDLRGLNDYEVANTLDELASVSAYEAALTASGGWCAPSEILYDLFETICPNPALFTLPTFRANRGGVRWPIFEQIDFTQEVDFIWTEADDIAATGTKPCFPITCPVFDECRLAAHGVCVTIGNFIDRGYPEQVRWFLNRVFFLHARNESLFKLNAVLAESDSATVAASFGTASAVVAALLLQTQAYNDRNGRCCGALVEAVAPCWLKEAIRADIARQDFGGVGNAGLVSDATIRSWFADAGLSIRFIDFWQALDDAVAPGPLVWPTTVDILFYTPGAYVQFDGGTLDLGVTRDSILNATNDFNIFTEDFFCIGRRGPRGVNVTVPICPLGEVGGRNPSSGEVVCPVA